MVPFHVYIVWIMVHKISRITRTVHIFINNRPPISTTRIYIRMRENLKVTTAKGET